jgi:hypothetical protein
LRKEGEQVGVNLVGVSCWHSVRVSRIDLQLGAFDNFGGLKCGGANRHDLIIVAVKDKSGTSNFFKSSVKSVSEKALMQS